MDVAGLKPGQEIQPVDISFRLGPRINASGRLADAALSVELMLSDDAAFCVDAARQLDGFNRERQEIERQITEAAERMVEEHYAEAHGIVLFDEEWHPGVVGIVASRVTRKYHRPCIVLGDENGLAKGSGRSIYGLNLVETLGDVRRPPDQLGRPSDGGRRLAAAREPRGVPGALCRGGARLGSAASWPSRGWRSPAGSRSSRCASR